MMPNKKPVTLEDLIRLKRSERPPAEFWSEFDREMRAKQLAAIVEPRPWWAPFIRVGARVSHYQVPVGAAAILALSFVAVREYRVTDVSPQYQYRNESVSVEELGSSARQVAVVSEHLLKETQLPVSAPAATQIEAAPMVAQEDDAVATQVGRASHVVALPEPEAAKVNVAPSASFIEANLTAAQAVDPRLVDDAFGSPVRISEKREPVRDPLAQLGASGESRRSRLLEPAFPVASTTGVTVGTSDRVARRLTEERLYDTISRVGLKGDRVAIKF